MFRKANTKLNLNTPVKNYTVLFLLVVIFISLALTSAVRKSPVSDEAAHHIPVGYVFLTKGDFAFATDSPPLARILAALPLLSLDVKLPDERSFWAREDRAEFSRDFLYKLNRSIFDKILLFARIPMMILGVFGGVFLFFWVRKHYDSQVAVLTAIFYFLSPNILAHSRFATTDIAASVFIMCSVLSFWDFLISRRNIEALISGIFLALAMMAKYSALLLLPIYIILVLGTILNERFFKGKRVSLDFFFKLLFCLFISALVLWSGYAFEFKPFLKDVLRPESKIVVFTDMLNSIPFAGEGFKAKAVEFLYTASVPLGSFVLGVIGVLKHAAEGVGIFFMGAWRHQGHPLYYVAAFLLKTPIPVIIFFFIGLIFAARNKSLNLYLLLMIFSFFVFASRSNLQLGLRYVLPVYPFIFIISALGAKYVFNKGTVYKTFGIVLILWFLTVPFFIWPDYLSYFNESIGGPDNGHKYLRDSNIDWGQDLPALKQYMLENNIESVKLAYFGEGDPTYYGIRSEDITEIELIEPEKEVYAISIRHIDSCRWTKDKKPDSKAGYSIFIYDLREKE